MLKKILVTISAVIMCAPVFAIPTHNINFATKLVQSSDQESFTLNINANSIKHNSGGFKSLKGEVKIVTFGHPGTPLSRSRVTTAKEILNDNESVRLVLSENLGTYNSYFSGDIKLLNERILLQTKQKIIFEVPNLEAHGIKDFIYTQKRLPTEYIYYHCDDICSIEIYKVSGI